MQSKPSRKLLLAVAVTLGMLTGLGSFTFTYSEGASYLSDDPRACTNCHVMQDHYDAWLHSSHASVATCNSCHIPSTSFVAKYAEKASAGWHHSLAFTTGNFPDRIRISEGGRRVVEASCRGCHARLTDAIDGHSSSDEAFSCVRCHADVGH